MQTQWKDALNDLLVCPVCRQSLVAGAQGAEPAFFLCGGCGRSYPVQDGIPILIAERATMARPLE